MGWGVFKKIIDGVKKGFDWFKKNKDTIGSVVKGVSNAARGVASMIPGRAGERARAITDRVGNFSSGLTDRIESIGDRLVPKLTSFRNKL